jgi:large subunit ribosomal protein L9
MKVYLLQDVKSVGMAGEVLKVSDGYANNFLFPRKLAVQLTAQNEQFYQTRVKAIENRKEVISTETSMLAEKIKSLKITLKRKVHDGDRLYGAIRERDIVDALAEQNIKIGPSQVLFGKSIKSVGNHTVTIKLSSRLQPELAVKIIAE